MKPPQTSEAELMLVQRHLQGRWKQNVLVTAGIALAVAALVIVMSVANGFHQDLTERVLGLTAHVIIVPAAGSVLSEPDSVIARTKQMPELEALGHSASLFTQGLLSVSEIGKSVQVRGVTLADELAVSPTLGKSAAGDLSSFRDRTIILGSGVAKWLGVAPGDLVTITVLSQGRTDLTVAAVFDSGVAQYDSGFAYLPLATLQRLLGQDGAISEVRIRLADPFTADEAATVIESALPDVNAITWRELNRSLFEGLVMEKRVFGLVLSLMLVIAGFGSANVLTMHILQRRQDIAILSTMGLSLRRIRTVFLLQGGLLSLCGAVIGCGVGLVGAGLIQTFGLPLPGDVYPIDTIPVQVRAWDVVVSVLGAVVIGTASSYVPARRISEAVPVEVLRHG